jgi:membrane protease YdiL (CAAX protease family)
MDGAGGAKSLWSRIPPTARAIAAGLLIGLAGANVWSLLAVTLGPQLWTAVAEVLFLVVYLAWASGRGPPRSTRGARGAAFRVGPISRTQWVWGLTAAAAFAITVHAALVVLFRLTPFPATAFHQGYDLSYLPGATARWLAVIISAASAGICEETGFRGYMQRPIESRHGPAIAIAVSAVLFTLVHMNKSWLVVGMAPLVLGAGLLLGTLAWASRTLVFCMIGHTLMDIGLFAYWWTQIAGVFTAPTIFQSGPDAPFFVAGAIFASALALTLFAIVRLRRLSDRRSNRARL